MEMDKEEGEMSDDPMLGDEDNDCIPEEDVKPTLLYKAEKEGLIITQLEKIDAKKLEERAKRFGLNLSGNRLVTQKQIDELYRNFGIESGNERHFRFDALHLNGVAGLKEKDIFEYLADYKPVSLEWIDENSCNIVCQDHISAALALLVHSREIKNEDLKDMLKKSSHHWREGVPHPKKDLILMRFATNGDKKLPKKVPERKAPEGYYDEILDPPTKNPWGDLCKSWGVYDNQEVIQHRLPKNDYEDEIEEPVPKVQIRNKRLAMRLGKRHHNNVEEQDEDSDSDTEWKKKSKAPRMRMHADDEESKQNKKRQAMELTKAIADKDVYAPLSIEVVNSRSNYTPRESVLLSDKFKYHNKTTTNKARNNVQSRLGAKILHEDVPSSSDEYSYSSDESDHNTMSRVQKMSTAKSSSSVWSRLESKPTNASDHNDLRQILKSKKHSTTKTDDLRDRISKYKRAPLRIEIDNK
ncbi:nuclear cap-binding protein subunit 3-like [Cydia pomonella]|uniref:nuclear cap-binding protein subunit 3-like n=1 Tax=Cydia pomonella TaxID=82600 RepID=UPI002ADD96A0|nr:nuclear cap-binding protein subunit 3-like [Cydia pomonella]